MATQVLIFDIGGTVFDWNTALLEALKIAFPDENTVDFDRGAFALDCRARFLDVTAAVVRGERPWQTADQIFEASVRNLLTHHNLPLLGDDADRQLVHAWRRMPAWPGAREGIASLRQHYVTAPLTLLSWPMAVGSSRRNGIVWDSILSCDVLGFYKPDPRCYTRAAEIADCPPSDMMMVASHPSDLRAARESGYRTAYVLPKLEDPGDDYTDKGFRDEFDYVARDFIDLAAQLRP